MIPARRPTCGGRPPAGQQNQAPGNLSQTPGCPTPVRTGSPSLPAPWLGVDLGKTLAADGFGRIIHGGGNLRGSIVSSQVSSRGVALSWELSSSLTWTHRISRNLKGCPTAFLLLASVVCLDAVAPLDVPAVLIDRHHPQGGSQVRFRWNAPTPRQNRPRRDRTSQRIGSRAF